MHSNEIIVYTDGSCDTLRRIGAWVAIILFEKEKMVLKGNDINTTHNRMELLAVIKAIEYVDNILGKDYVIQLFTDSQYVMNLPARSGKLKAANYITKRGAELQNADLMKRLIHLFTNRGVYFNKIKAHQKKDDTINYNREADHLSRRMVRALVSKAG